MLPTRHIRCAVCDGIIAGSQARPQLSISAELAAPGELLELASHVAQELLHLALQLGIARHGQLDLDHPALPPLAGTAPPLAWMSGMGGVIGGHEGLALLRRQMADAKDRLQMPCRDRDRIAGICYL